LIDNQSYIDAGLCISNSLPLGIGQMRESTGKMNQLLAKDQAIRDREALMVYIVNLSTPYEGWGSSRGWNPEESADFLKRLRDITEKHWPELWQPPCDNPKISIEESVWNIIRELREYLRRFWGFDPAKTSDEIAHDRDWHIHRAREWWYSREIQAEVLKVDETARPFKHKFLLDTPPQRHNHITKALYELQKRALKPSTAPRICPNECENRYFLSNKKGEVYCPDCRRSQAARDKANKRKSYHANKNTWPSTAAKRRENRG